jgi:hypothetical protein
MRIEISPEEVNNRGSIIHNLLKPLVTKPQNIFALYKGNREETIITIQEKGASNTEDYENWRFNTIAPRFQAMYHERWKRSYKDKKEFFYLYRAYLHFYHYDEAENQDFEFLLLHCDPNEPDNAAHAEYKQSLHLHIECGKAPFPHGAVWPKAHIALNVGYSTQVLKDIGSLTEALKVAILMLQSQVLDKLVRLSTRR